MDQFLLFGDSITQQSFSQERGFALGAALTDAYVRRLDVVNRGLSGYNALQALKVIEQVIPRPENARLRFVTVWFGANDSRLKGSAGTPQHVPLPIYTETMRKILTHRSIHAHQGVRIILLTCPPVEEQLQEALDKSKMPDLAALRRTAEENRRYAVAGKDLAAELNLPCLDVWSVMMKYAGYAGSGVLPGSKQNGAIDVKLAELLSDGLHFNPAGYRLIYDELMSLIAKTWPDQMPEKLPFVLPTWDHQSAWSDIQPFDG